MNSKLVVVTTLLVLLAGVSSVALKPGVIYASVLMERDNVVLAPYHWNVNENGTMFSMKLNQENYTAFLKLLNKTNDIGFGGVALHDVSLFYDDGLLNRTLTDIEKHDLDVILYIVWRDKTIKCTFEEGNASESYWSVDFPLNDTQHYAFVDYLGNVASIASGFECVKGYALFYPFNWTYPLTYVESNMNNSKYRAFLQSYVNTIRTHDSRPIYLVSDMIEDVTETMLPYDIEEISGYGFTFYSRKADEIDRIRLYGYVSFYEEKLKENIPNGTLFVAEWGFKTTPFDHYYASASNESIKTMLINETLSFFHEHNLSHAYFCLHNIPNAIYSRGDWGLIHDDFNLTLKLSGEKMKQIIPEFPSLLILPLFMIATLLAVTPYRRKPKIG